MDLKMSYRVVEFAWLPRTPNGWRTFGAARREAARLWNDLMIRHQRIRRMKWQWPTKVRWCKWAKGRYPALHSQSVQQIIGEFLEAVSSARQLRKKGDKTARYPRRLKRYRDVVYTNQSARIRTGWLLLPNGISGHLRIRLPKRLTLPGRLLEVRLMYNRVLLVCEVEAAEQDSGPVIGVDLGVNTLIAATDGAQAIVISGRAAKATVQWRNKNLASIQKRQSRLKKGSRRWKKLQRRKREMLDKTQRRIKDMCHKATRKVADAFPNAQAFVGEPFNDAAQKMGRVQAQQVSQACNAKLIQQLRYKLHSVQVIPEPYSSQTCPVCEKRNKQRRVYRCSGCGCVAPRDVIGATNILGLGKDGEMLPERTVPHTVRFVYPVKYPGHRPGSSGRHPASSLS